MNGIMVLMSVWTSAGNPYWEKQLASIYAQEGVDVSMLVHNSIATLEEIMQSMLSQGGSRFPAKICYWYF